MNARYWEIRICQHCKQEFWIRKCYLRRGHGAGTYCGKGCSGKSKIGIGNPNISELGKLYGPKEAKKYKQKTKYQETRIAALRLVGGCVCGNCGCDVLSILEINHVNGGGAKRKECGVKLWRLVLALKEQAKLYFNVRCKVCNQLDYVERYFQIRRHKILWQK